MIKSVFISSSSACFEWQNNEAYYSPKEYTVYLNGEWVYFGNTNVFSLFDLTPNTEYELVSEGEKLTFKTKAETAAVSVRDFGACGDGVTDDTEAIRAAINCLPRGARLYFPSGVYLTAPISLKSHMTLELSEGATLLGIADRSKYPAVPGCVPELCGGDDVHLGGWEGCANKMYLSLIYAEYAEDITIVGRGRLDGNGEAGGWWEKEMIRGPIKRPRLMFFNRCDGIRLHGISLSNSPCWNIHPYFSSNVDILDISITAPKDSPNTDAIDPEACDRVDIIGCKLSVGDDCIAIKSGKIDLAAIFKKPADRHTVRNCLMQFGHGALTLGSEISGGVTNLTVNRCVFERTDRGLRIKTRRGRGKYCVIDGVVFENIKMTGVLTPIVINSFYFCDPEGHTEYAQTREPLPIDDRTPYLGSFTFKNMECTDCEVAACYCEGLPERPIASVALENINFSFSDSAKPEMPAMCEHVEPMCRAGMVLKCVDKLTLKNVKVENNLGRALACDRVSEIIEE